MKPRFAAGLMSAVMMLLLSQTGCSEMSFMPKQKFPWQKKSVNEIAQEVTVFIDGCSLGSGVIFQKDGNTYSVLTARHVVSNDVDCLVITPDGEKHTAKAKKFKVYEGLDLAVMQFESSKNYPLGELEKSEKVTLGQKISIAGAPIPNETIPKRALRLSDGTIISTPPEGNLGRTLVYSNTTKVGMSGGPVLDDQGRVIGIHTAADPKDGGREAYGIPILKFLTGKVSRKPKAQDADTYLSRGLALYLKKDYQGAITNYDQAIKLNPNYAPAYYIRGVARSELGDNLGAITDYNQALKLNPNDTDTYSKRGGIRYELRDKQGALTDFEQVIKLNPNDAQAYLLPGMIRYELGNKQDALTYFDKAIKLNPNFVDAYVSRSRNRAALGDLQGAIADLDQAIKLNPNYAEAYTSRGTLHYVIGDLQGAIADLDQAIKLNPNYAEAYMVRGGARYKLGDKQGGIKDLQKAAELSQQQGDQKTYKASLEVLRLLQGQ